MSKKLHYNYKGEDCNYSVTDTEKITNIYDLEDNVNYQKHNSGIDWAIKVTVIDPGENSETMYFDVRKNPKVVKKINKKVMRKKIHKALMRELYQTKISPNRKDKIEFFEDFDIRKVNKRRFDMVMTGYNYDILYTFGYHICFAIRRVLVKEEFSHYRVSAISETDLGEEILSSLRNQYNVLPENTISISLDEFEIKIDEFAKNGVPENIFLTKYMKRELELYKYKKGHIYKTRNKPVDNSCEV